jgi:hypothetical protein
LTGWDIVNEIIKNFPPIAATVFLVTVSIIFAVGFFRHGMNFIKYGFKQIALDSSIEKRIDELEAKLGARIDALAARMDDMENRMEKRFEFVEKRIECIETNHFGHLKNYLGILNGVLLDKGVIDNATKARLDNELRGM